MKLIDNPKSVAGHISTWALAIATAIPAVWVSYPELHALVPADKLPLVTGVVTLIGLVGKFVQQGKPE